MFTKILISLLKKNKVQLETEHTAIGIEKN